MSAAITFESMTPKQKLNILREHRIQVQDTLEENLDFPTLFNFYSDKAHFVFELLQNAEDAQATKARFVLNENELSFIHNGKRRFSCTDPSKAKEYKQNNRPQGDINAITLVAKSQKSNTYDKEGTLPIGKFGVGFKAIYNYSDSPQIYTDDYKFKINDVTIPEWIDEELANYEKGTTVFILPLGVCNPLLSSKVITKETAYNEIKARLNEIETPQLFLENLLEVDIIYSDAETKYIGKRFSRIVNSDTMVFDIYDIKQIASKDLLVLNNSSKLKLSKMDTVTFNHFSELIVLDNRPFKTTVLCPFLQIGDNNEVVIGNRKPIYSYFETAVQSQSILYMHGPFELTTDRANIKATSDINETIMQSIANNVIKCIDWLAKNNMLNTNVWEHLPIDRLTYSESVHKEKDLRNILVNKIESELVHGQKPWIPKVSGGYCKANEAKIAKASYLLDILSDKELGDLLGINSYYWAFPDLKNVAQSGIPINILMTQNCKIQILDHDDLTTKFTEKFMKSRSNEWLLQFYSVCQSQAGQHWKGTGRLMYQPIFKMRDGKFKPLFTGKNQPANLLRDKSQLSSGLDANILDETLFQIINDKIGSDILNNAISFIDGIKFGSYDQIADFSVRYEKLKDLVFERYEDQMEDYIEVLASFWGQIGVLNAEVHKIAMDFNSFHLFRCILNSGEVIYCKASDVFLPGLQHEAFTKSINYRKINLEYFMQIDGKVDWLTILSSYGVKDFPVITDKEVMYSDSTLLDTLYDSLNIRPTKAIDTTKIQCIIGLQDAVKELKSKNDCEILWNVLLAQNCEYLYKSTLIYYRNIWKEVPLDPSPTKVILSEYKWIWNGVEIVSVSSLTLNQFRSLPGYNNLSINEHLDVLLRSLPFKIHAPVSEESQNLINDNNISLDELRLLVDLKSITSDNDTIQDIDSADGHLLLTLKEAYENLKYKLEKKRLIDEKAESMKIENIYKTKWFLAMLSSELNSTALLENKSIKERYFNFRKVEGDQNSGILKLLSPVEVLPDLIENIDLLGIKLIINYNGKEVYLQPTISIQGLRYHRGEVEVRIDRIQNEELLAGHWDKIVGAKLLCGSLQSLDEQLHARFLDLVDSEVIELDTHLINDYVEGSNLEFIFGPPGTGKTHFLIEEVIKPSLLDGRKNILVLSPTHKACNVIAKRLFDDQEVNNEKLVRFGYKLEEDFSDICYDNSFVGDLSGSSDCCFILTSTRYYYQNQLQSQAGSSVHNFSSVKDDLNPSGFNWDIVIIDEASMMKLPELVFILHNLLQQDRMPRIYIAGDPLQLGPIYNSSKWNKAVVASLGNNELAEANIYGAIGLLALPEEAIAGDDKYMFYHNHHNRQYKVTVLRKNWRSLPHIVTSVGNYCYDNKLLYSRSIEDSRYSNHRIGSNLVSGYIRINVPTEEGFAALRPVSVGSSCYHPYAVVLAVELAIHLAKGIDFASLNLSGGIYTIGIITAYAAQSKIVGELLSYLVQDTTSYSIKADTIHGFQGDECDLVIMVANSSNPTGASRNHLINNRKLLNVALSRARDYFILIETGDLPMGLSAISNYREWITCINPPANFSSEEIEGSITGGKSSNVLVGHIDALAHNPTNVYLDSQTERAYGFRSDKDNIDILVYNERRHLLLKGEAPTLPWQKFELF